MEGAGTYSAVSDANVDWILVKGTCDWATEFKNDEPLHCRRKYGALFITCNPSGRVGSREKADRTC